MRVTDLQFLVFDYIASTISSQGWAPTRAEIATRFDLWPNHAQQIVAALARKGFIAVKSRAPRGIELTAP